MDIASIEPGADFVDVFSLTRPTLEQRTAERAVEVLAPCET